MHVSLKEDRERTVLAEHPWIFSGGINRAKSSADAMGVVDIRDHEGHFLGRGFYNPKSQIAVRMLTREQEPIDKTFFVRRIRQAVALRTMLFSTEGGSASGGDAARTDGYRLVFGEGDGLPGLVVDRYRSTLVVQFQAAAAEHFRETLLDALMEVLGPTGIFERSDVGSRKADGIGGEPVGVRRGMVPDGPMEILEEGLRAVVNIRTGQKTGYAFDQRDNRVALRRYCKDQTVLNLFSHTGGFTVNALAGGAARVISVDGSSAALELGQASVLKNGFVSRDDDWLVMDAFDAIDRFAAGSERFGVVVLDPPAFAKTSDGLERALKAYTKTNAAALGLVAPGGILLTSSCSHHVSPELFSNMLHLAALRAGRQMQVLEVRGAGADHPQPIHFREGTYLKCVIARVL